MKMCIIPGDRYCTKCRPCLVDHFVFQNNNYIFRAVISTVKMLRFYFLANIANEKKSFQELNIACFTLQKKYRG